MLKRIINYPMRGIGKSSIDKITLSANTNGRAFLGRAAVPRCARRCRGTGANAIQLANDDPGPSSRCSVRVLQLRSARSNTYDMAFAVGKQTGL